jgi:surfactin synthase thioesterase subunit
VTVKEVDAGHFFMDTHRNWVLEQVRHTLSPFAVNAEPVESNSTSADWQQDGASAG